MKPCAGVARNMLTTSERKKTTMTIHEFQNFIPVCTELGDGYLLYVVNTGMYSNACYAVVLCDGGHIKHFMDHQFTVYPNNTAMITEK
jgi:hypothetical protein